MYQKYYNLLLTKIQTSKIVRKQLMILLLSALILLGFAYWLHGNRYISTDDAYVNANVVQMAPQVTGPVAKLYVTNNQFVRQNQLLFIIDTEPFQIALNKARAELDEASSELRLSIYTTTRTENLVKKNVLPPQAHDDAMAQLQKTSAKQKFALASLAQAELDLKHTKIFSPVTGWITNMSLREGNIVTANQLLFALISNDEYWVDANFKETELKHIHQGQKAKINIDMYPSNTFTGIVESISSGTGAVFSLLPPQNATGNWIKITQRVPVKIHILNTDNNQNPKYPLRIGTTADVTIDTLNFFHIN